MLPRLKADIYPKNNKSTSNSICSHIEHVMVKRVWRPHSRKASILQQIRKGLQVQPHTLRAPRASNTNLQCRCQMFPRLLITTQTTASASSRCVRTLARDLTTHPLSGNVREHFFIESYLGGFVRHRHGPNYAAPLPYTKNLHTPGKTFLTAVHSPPSLDYPWIASRSCAVSITKQAVAFRYHTGNIRCTACCFVFVAFKGYPYPNGINLYNPFIVVTIVILIWLHLTKNEWNIYIFFYSIQVAASWSSVCCLPFPHNDVTYSHSLYTVVEG
jgi:hypothetical protein